MAVTVLDEVYTRQATHEEVLEYATWLGMDLEHDIEFIPIAEEGLCSPPPSPWKPCRTVNGDIFYFNFDTKDSTWEHPCDAIFRSKYEEAKRDRDEPKLVVTLAVSSTADDAITLHCTGSLTGAEVAVLEVCPSMTLGRFRELLAAEVKVSTCSLHIVLPCGKVLSQNDQESAIAEIIGSGTAC